MKITVEMPNVAECQVSECAYNRDQACHARAITVGDGVKPGCDTYYKTGSHVRKATELAGVGACKVSGCQYNDDFECQAANIQVGFVGDSVDCLTFASR